MNVKQYLASIGSEGGKAKTAAKSAAAIANGKLGGRPKSKKRIARRHNVENQAREPQTLNAPAAP